MGHACVLFENSDIRLLQDPWLETPAYFNSWFHFPRSVEINKIPKPTHIYVSHTHQDHLNKESLSRFDKKTNIIIADVEPEFKGQPPVKDQIESLGFRKITELTNFESIEIGKTKLTMLVNQYDSGLCVKDPKITLLNTNDCIIEPLMGRIKAKFSPIDIAFMLPIAANPMPQCYELEDQNESKFTAQLRDMARFIQRTLYLQPKYVVPFACLYTHFLDELRHLTDGFTAYDSLEFMKPFIYPVNKKGPKIKPILMSPGDYWTTNKGFKKVNKFNWKNLDKEYRAEQKRVKQILNSRIKNGSERFYTSTHTSPIEINTITKKEREIFQKNFERFIKKLFKITTKDNFRVLFNFNWYNPIVDFRNKTITERNNKHNWDIKIKLSPEIFDFFMKNPAEWGNIMLSYRILITIKKGFREQEHKLQQYLYDAYTA